ncbi:hypothetical protein IV203_032008 [Nitzschia inconspicua]|uniref:Uncharacterized protein n=1 Tax=Nitzschia inconspicua TaxID=303405 RepID=A0A9K3Q3L6_9STRA|nr:hypothetical protein IV203_032008 [Nitzschia inconspicua]
MKGKENVLTTWKLRGSIFHRLSGFTSTLTRRNAVIIDTGVNESVPFSTMGIENQLRGVRGLNPANQPGLASIVGQGKASSEVMNHERAFAVT